MKTPEQLIHLFCSSPDWRERREAALGLGSYKTKESRDFLIGALNDTDEDVQHAVIIALGNTGDEEAVEHLLLPRFLRHSSANVRWAALKTIGKIGRFCRIPDIIELTEDEEWVVRNEAMNLIRKQTESILEHCSPAAAHRLVNLLVDSKGELHAVILDALLRIGPQIKPFLREVLKTGGTQAKLAMAYILGGLKDAESIPLLIDLLESPEEGIRKSAIEALGQIGHESSILALLEKYGDPAQENQESAVSAVAKIGKAALPALHEKLHFSSRKTIQRNVILTLTKIGDPSSIPYLINHLASTYFIVRRAAVTGLVHYGKNAIEGVLDVIRNVKLPIVDDLLERAECGATVNIRVRVIKALGALADHRAVHLLKKLAASTDPAIQRSSLDSLAEIGCSCWQRCGALAVLRELRIAPDVDLIIEQLGDDSENVRMRAIQVLARGGNTRAVHALLQTVYNDNNSSLRCEALRAADELAPANASVVETARRSLSNPSSTSHLQAEAVRIMGRSPDERQIPALIGCLSNSSWEVRRNAALALGNMGEKALPALMDRLRNSDSEMELESVIRAIGNVGALDAVSVIEDVMLKHPQDSNIHDAARKAILDIRQKAA